MRLIQVNHQDPAFNLALEEYVLNNWVDDDYLILWVNQPCLVVGKFQNVFQEIHLKQAYEKGIPIYRRISGGGTVYQDEENLNFTFITNWNADIHDYNFFLRPIMQMLCQNNLPVTIGGICNLMLDGKKISGNAQTISKNRILHHGTLLFNSDLRTLKGLLNSDYRHYSSKAMRSLHCDVMNIKEYHGNAFKSVEEFMAVIAAYFKCRKSNAVVFYGEQEQEINKLANDKYRTWEWNMGMAANYEFSKTIESSPMNKVSYVVRDGYIQDFMVDSYIYPTKLCDEIAKRFLKQRLDYQNIKMLRNEICYLYNVILSEDDLL